MGGGLFYPFLCECEAEELALSLFSVDCSNDFTSANFLFSCQAEYNYCSFCVLAVFSANRLLVI
jgi:hypothetical protein